ncbi:response regulator [Vagococcus fluvialis]|uniref:response regulator n=1 Tax=Vagococcus fluvialis TaxID=2738 RepID=UPI001A8CE11D|nr:response regulator [Vagococcus fluvialis]MBO0479709.1 response regulator [Vagococcus fluvialis]MBO0485279.1 response regulator [Vagococcus fluvialis]
MTHILIIEDDPMVQFIHQSYLEKISSNYVIDVCTSIEDSLLILKKKSVDLILLDIHLEDGNGLNLLSELRTKKRDIDVILITASKEAILVKESLHLGVLDYLIKPFTFERFAKSIALYQKKIDQLNSSELDQSLIDSLIQPYSADTLSKEEEMEKGLTQETLTLVIKTIQKLEQPFTIQALTQATNLSHVSIRKYVSHLEKKQQLTSKNIYLKVGRPYKTYIWNEKNNQRN